MTLDRAAAVEAVRKHHYEISFDFERICYECRQEWPCETITLLRAYEAVVTQLGPCKPYCSEAHCHAHHMMDEITTLRAQHAALVPVLDAALAWEKAWSTTFAYPLGFMDKDQVLIDAIRAYRAAKEGT